MMRQPLHRFLEEFGSDVSSGPPLGGFRPQVVETKPPQPDPVIAQLQESYARGYEDGEAKARSEAEAQAAELAADFDRQLEEAKRALGQDIAKRLAVELRGGIERAEARLAAHVAAVLMPVLETALAESATRGLVDEIGGMLRSRQSMTIEVSGPEPLVDRVRQTIEASEMLKAAITDIRFSSGPGPEVRVTLADSIVETRLTEWLARIKEVVG